MRRLLRPLGRYAQVGLLCALINNAIVIALDRAGIGYVLGVTTAFIAVMIVGYLLHATYTFGVAPTPAGWLRFTAANALGFPLAMASMAVLRGGFGLDAAIAMPIATVIQFAWNYALARWLLVRPAAAA